MLWWMSSKWVHVHEEGYYETLREYLAGMFAIIGGLSLLYFINNATHEKFRLRRELERAAALEEILKASGSLRELQSLKKKHQERMSMLSEALSKPLRDDNLSYYRGESMKARMDRQLVQELSELISLIDGVESKLHTPAD